MRESLSIAVLALVSLATLAAQPAARTDARIAALERRLKLEPADAALSDQLAGAFLQKMRETADGAYLQRASRLVDAVLRSDPKNYEARRRLMEIEMNLHHFRRVVALAEPLSTERPKDTIVWGLLGDALMETGQYDRAADAYQTMADLRPSLASFNRVAFYRFVTGDTEGAIQIMRQAIRMGSPEPENVAWCLADLGGMLFKTGAIAEAEAAYREALARFPGYHHALAGLGRIMASRGRWQEAIDLLLRAQAAAPFPEYAGLLAKLYRKTGKEEPARKQIALLDAADTLGRAAGEAANRNLALALADLEHNTGRALQLARAELEVRADVYTYDALAWALFRNGNIEDAEAIIQKALGQNTPEPSFHEHAARILEALGHEAAAREQRERAAALNPNFDLALSR